MRRISSWVMFYSQVLDVLSQHHPEYLALAWGATRFVLMVGSILAPTFPCFLTNGRA